MDVNNITNIEVNQFEYCIFKLIYFYICYIVNKYRSKSV